MKASYNNQGGILTDIQIIPKNRNIENLKELLIVYKIGLIYTFVPYFDIQTFTENLLKQSVCQVSNTNIFNF